MVPILLFLLPLRCFINDIYTHRLFLSTADFGFLRGETRVGFSFFITFAGACFARFSFGDESVSVAVLSFFMGDTFVGELFSDSLVE